MGTAEQGKERPRLFENGVVLTLAAARPRASALAVQRGRIVSVGERDEVGAALGEDVETIDLGGRTLVPGFIDAHQHFAPAVIERGAVDCRPDVAPDIDRLQERLRAKGRELPEGRWLLAMGYDELALREGRHPNRDDLDAACPNRAVLLCHYSGHEAVASSRALEQAGIDRHTADPPAGVIEHGRNGHPNGRLIETAFSPLLMRAHVDLLRREPEDVRQRLRRWENELFASGITRVCDAAVGPVHERLYQQWRDDGLLRMPVVMMLASGEGLLCPPWDRMRDGGGARTGSGPEDLRVGSLKVFLDGANRCLVRMTLGQMAEVTLRVFARALRTRSAAVLRNTSDMKMRLGRDGCVRTGVSYLSREDGHRIVEMACEAGFSVAIHAIGNGAIEQAIDALGRVRGRHPDTPPPRIEHASLIRGESARRAADHGIAVVSQPGFLDLPVFHQMPVPRGLRVLPHRTWLDAGVRLAGSSDTPVIGFDPLAAMRRAVTRRSTSGAELQPAEAITPGEALALYTREAAYVTGSLDTTGTLEPGKRADLVVLSEDPTASPAALERARVERTIVGGCNVFSVARGE